MPRGLSCERIWCLAINAFTMQYTCTVLNVHSAFNPAPCTLQYREHPLHKRLLALMQPPTAGGESGAAAASPLGRIRRIDVRVLIPKWVFGLGNIRFIEGLAGGAMMDAGSYCAHASRELAAAAGATHPLTVTSAAAKLCPACSQTDGGCEAAGPRLACSLLLLNV